MIKKYILLIFIFPLFFFLNCGGYNPNEATGEGSIVFKLELQDTPLASKPQSEGESQLPRMAPLDCTTTGVSTVLIDVYDSSNNVIASGGPWNCSDHSGTIANVSAGSNRKVIILGRDSSETTLYSGEVTGITVTANQTSNAGTITASPFVPTLLSPANGSTVSPTRSVNFNGYDVNMFENVTWSTIAGASSYDSAFYADSTLTLSLGGGSGSKTFLGISSHCTNVIAYRTQYWRVRATDRYGKWGNWSNVWSFTQSGRIWCGIDSTTGQPTYDTNG